MFEFNGKYEVDRRNLKCDHIRHSPSDISTKFTANSQIYKNIPREDSVISLLNSFLELEVEVIKITDNSRYENGKDKRLVTLGPTALLTTSSSKHIENNTRALIVPLMYKLKTSSRGNDDFSIGFDRDHKRRQGELTNDKNIRGKYHIKIMFKGVSSFAEHQEKKVHMVSSIN